MKPDKKQLPQLIVLGVLVVATMAVVSFQFLGGKKTPPPAPVTQAQQPADQDAQEQQKTEAEEPEKDKIITSVFPDLESIPARRDPFMPQSPELIAKEVIEIIQPTLMPQKKPEDVAKANLQPKQVVELPKEPVPQLKPLNPFKESSEPVPQVPDVKVQPRVEPKPEPDPQFVLTGIIRGDKNVAIIRSGEGGRYIVKEGQLIDGRYKVISVTDDGAVLVYKNRRINVKLGGAS